MSSTLLDHIAAAVADEYAVLGTLGTSPRGSAFLARERAGGHLVVLAVPPAADELAVLGSVSDEVPANAGACTVCGAPPPSFSARCPQCGRAFVLNTVGAHRFTAAEVTRAAAGVYDVLGEVAHQAGGSMFFVRDRVDGRLVALAAQVDEEGGQALQAVWDALQGDRALVGGAPDAGTDTGTEPPVDFGGASPQSPEGAPPGYPPEFRDPDRNDAVDPTAFGPGVYDDRATRPRRRWVPFAVAGTLALVAGGAWATMRDRDRSAAPTPADSVRVGGMANTTPDALPGGSGGASADPVTGPADSAAGSRVAPLPPPPPPPSDSARLADVARQRAADSVRRALATPAFVQLDGSLPAGWTWTVNGRRGPSSVTARLRPGRPAVLRIEAPGYCPETLQLDAPAPGSTQRWAPRLRGKPMVGEC